MNSKESNNRLRVGILSTHAAPYRDVTFAALQRRGVVDITVISLLDSSPEHSFWDLKESNYPHITLKKCCAKFRTYWFHPQVLSVLRKERFDVIVIPGYEYACWLVIIYCQITKTPFIFSSDTIRDRPASRIRRFLASRVLSFIRGSSGAFWVPGEGSRQYLCNKGIKNDRIFEGCYNLDFATITDQLELFKKERFETRKRLSINDDGFVFMMVANVIAKRRHDLLLESFSRVVIAYPNSYLVLVGKGTEEETIMRLSKDRRIENVRAVGPVPFASLGPLFTMSDAYVHSGGEAYSTAVEYAAIAGLPVITTPSVGAAKDYVIDGETGYIVSSEDVSLFAEKMLLLARDRETSERFGRRSRELASKFTAEWAADQLEKAVTIAYEHRTRIAGLSMY